MTIELKLEDKVILLTNKPEHLKRMMKDYKLKFSEFVSNRYKCYTLYLRNEVD